ncbi:MAG: hypothetical protein DRJ05_09405 [Bacteroidetes bacterium]|nr:MAG: hypothetical protein DRJ05_09405 [Bacteroidota bacterium]
MCGVFSFVLIIFNNFDNTNFSANKNSKLRGTMFMLKLVCGTVGLNCNCKPFGHFWSWGSLWDYSFTNIP